MIAIREFIQQIIYIAIVAIIIELILPKGNTKKYVYVILSLFILLNILSPIINVIRDMDIQNVYEDILSNISENEKINTDDTIAVFSEYKNEKVTQELKEEMLKDIEKKISSMNVKVIDVDININGKYEVERLEVYINNLDYLGEDSKKKILDIITMLETEYEIPNSAIVITEEAI